MASKTKWKPSNRIPCQKHTKANAVKAMNEVLAVASTPHDCDRMRAKLIRKGLHFSDFQLYKWLCQMVVDGLATSHWVSDGPYAKKPVFERPPVAAIIC